MSLINTSTATYIWINGVDVSPYIISGSVSDESVLTTSIISTSGTIQLAGSTNRSLILDYDKTNFPIGSKIEIWCQLPNGNVSRHPRGTLYITNSKVDIQNQILELEVGCSLSILNQYEDLYPNAVKLLYFLVKDYLPYYELEDFTLSTLNNILTSVGDLIYQDAYGNVQLITGYSENIAFTADAPKATFYDDYSCISVETIEGAITAPEEISVFLSLDVISTRIPPEYVDPNSILSDSGNNDYPTDGDVFAGGVDPITGESGNPDTGSTEDENEADAPARAPSVSQNQVRRNSVKAEVSFVQQLLLQKTSQQTGGVLPPSCGSAINPDPPQESVDPYKWDIKFEAEIESLDIQFEETTENITNTYYNAPGNQESSSLNIEKASHWNVSNSVISAWISSAQTALGQAVTNANNFYGVLNENLNNRDAKILELQLGKKQENTYVAWSAAEIIQLENARDYYDCVAVHASENGDFWINAARSIGSQVATLINGIGTNAVIVSRKQTTKSYGGGGELRKEVQLTYKPWVTSPRGQQLAKWNLDNVQISLDSNGVVVAVLPQLDYDTSLVLAQEQTTTYQYYQGYTKQTTETKDYFEPLNNQVQVELSSGNSQNPTESNRLQDSNQIGAVVSTTDDGGTLSAEDKAEFDAYAKDILNVSDAEYEAIIDQLTTIPVPCEVPTENIEITVKAINPPSTPFTTENWIGTTAPNIEKVDFPAQLKKIIPYQDNLGNCVLGAGATVDRYLSIMQKYANIEIKKRHADNRGIRVTEKMRSELFGYYPFYPVDISLSVVDKAFKCRSASATWVFDSTNALCSIDTYILSEIKDVTFDRLSVGFVDPSLYINRVFPFLQSVAYEALASDAGNFDAATSNGDISADAGEFTIDSSDDGSNLNGGDFDTGDTVPFEPPPIPGDAPVGLGSADPEADFGAYLIDDTDTVIAVGTIPSLGDDIDILTNIGIEISLTLPIFFNFVTSDFAFPGYNYGFILWKTGYPVDLGTIISPNTYTFNFGTIENPVDPVIESYVTP